ncbi:hypothetical protein COR50_18795 [Chitinophaga caeni]|uniref:Chemotaxis methyl-accepting receptor HlyB-like 4HB MCP domain-containing protein n=2 Tax=Chitinophaga caeni TaxID=2029983 RepID=A0A291QYX0_9BACT|nr:hypothetical protein COR50_18795 [Chitinophaga caeni]
MTWKFAARILPNPYFGEYCQKAVSLKLAYLNFPFMIKKITWPTRYTIACVLVGIMVILILVNVFEKLSNSKLDRSIQSIYADRLLPATYLHQISHNLYEQEILATTSSNTEKLQQHRDRIQAIIRDYETTYLTAEEQRYWLQFKSQLNDFYRADAQGKQQELTALQSTLQDLSRLQIGEGQNLKTHSTSLIGSNNLSIQLELALAIILGIVVIILLLKPNKHILNFTAPTVLN